SGSKSGGVMRNTPSTPEKAFVRPSASAIDATATSQPISAHGRPLSESRTTPLTGSPAASRVRATMPPTLPVIPVMAYTLSVLSLGGITPNLRSNRLCFTCGDRRRDPRISSLPLSSANDPKRIVLLAGHGALPARVSVNRPGNESGQRKRHQRDAHPALYFIDLRPRCKCLLKARSKTCPRLSRKAHNPSIRTVSSAFWVPESSAREAKRCSRLGNLLQGVWHLFHPRPLVHMRCAVGT